MVTTSNLDRYRFIIENLLKGSMVSEFLLIFSFTMAGNLKLGRVLDKLYVQNRTERFVLCFFVTELQPCE